MLDLDHFKRFNDNFGHDADDDVLKELANLLMHSIDVRSVVCRLGGEEFSVICPNTTEQEAIAVAETIIEKVRELHLSIK
ncbi:GGDEF domain-containing protein [Vibrio tapetis subsp. quintayensis]|uniref:GGDEF domain-containing protein n=1 Tax=Vibrio tapetis TaxID=52443 RepID=UPI0025B5EEB4|nr:GGDEF domain-containing protein [Vibrio tapetis]MDN3680887.1 GGDEF domain-containing protein [Vibrio tapetis subsp. quintayensis]